LQAVFGNEIPKQELIQFWVCTYGGILINKNESIQTFLLIKNTIISRD
jgi:hypothetical protein